MKNGLYHKDIFLPKIRLQDKPLKVYYSLHAIDAAKNDRYGKIILPDTINFCSGTIIEVELKNDKVVKILLRVNYSQKYDLCIVIGSQFRVRTVWLNDKNDNHHTLNRAKYITRAEAYS